MKKLYLLICVIALPLALLSCAHTTAPETTQPPTYTTRQWTPIYNDHICGINISWLDRERAGYEELSAEEIRSILPGKQPEGTTYTGYADFRKDGSVLRLRIRVKKGDIEAFIAIGSKAGYFACCISRETDAEASLCGDVEYKIYRQDDILFAETVCNEYPVLISVRAKTKAVDVGETGTMQEFVRQDIEQYRPLFEEILECLSWYGTNEPNLSMITLDGTE